MNDLYWIFIEYRACIFCLRSLCIQQFIYISYKLNVKTNCMFERGQSFNVYIGHQAYDAKPNQTLPICFNSLHQEVNQTEQRIIKLTVSVNSLQFMLFYTCLSFFNYNISFGFFLWYFVFNCFDRSVPLILHSLEHWCAYLNEKHPCKDFNKEIQNNIYNIYSWPISLKCSYTRLIDDCCKRWTTSIKIPIIYICGLTSIRALFLISHYPSSDLVTLQYNTVMEFEHLILLLLRLTLYHEERSVWRWRRWYLSDP